MENYRSRNKHFNSKIVSGEDMHGDKKKKKERHKIKGWANIIFKIKIILLKEKKFQKIIWYSKRQTEIKKMSVL